MRTRAFLFTAAALAAVVTAPAAQFTLSWSDNSTNEKGFEIYRAPGLAPAEADFKLIATVGVDVETYVDASLPNSAPFSYKLRAWNDAGVSGWSNTASGTTPPAPPDGIPGTLEATPPDKYVPPVPIVTLQRGEVLQVVAAP